MTILLGLHLFLVVLFVVWLKLALAYHWTQNTFFTFYWANVILLGVIDVIAFAVSSKAIWLINPPLLVFSWELFIFRSNHSRFNRLKWRV
ncbi:TPA: hypothetical protein DF272_05765 [Candidatus Falkowbacteria bacterium]|nr:hypothetical protein [Candidatus Falkowbacteria bacterium]